VGEDLVDLCRWPAHRPARADLEQLLAGSHERVGQARVRFIHREALLEQLLTDRLEDSDGVRAQAAGEGSATPNSTLSLVHVPMHAALGDRGVARPGPDAAPHAHGMTSVDVLDRGDR
jgi:hypothetical protein